MSGLLSNTSLTRRRKKRDGFIQRGRILTVVEPGKQGHAC